MLLSHRSSACRRRRRPPSSSRCSRPAQAEPVPSWYLTHSAPPTPQTARPGSSPAVEGRRWPDRTLPLISSGRCRSCLLRSPGPWSKKGSSSMARSPLRRRHGHSPSPPLLSRPPWRGRPRQPCLLRGKAGACPSRALRRSSQLGTERRRISPRHAVARHRFSKTSLANWLGYFFNTTERPSIPSVVLEERRGKQPVSIGWTRPTGAEVARCDRALGLVVDITEGPPL